MAINVRTVQDCINIMRVALGRRNENDPDQSDEIMLRYINDFASIVMPNDSKLFESFGTLTFTIDETHTDGVYTFNDVGSEFEFINISNEGFISLLDPVNNSISWNALSIYQDPGEFYSIWGINNDEILIPGYPTMMLFYGNEMIFRTIPEQAYMVKIYGYKKNFDYPQPDTLLQFDYWLRYIAYGAALNYARDYRLEEQAISRIQRTFSSERKQVMTRTHNQKKLSRCLPQF
jgi:hypothetical protein